MRPNLLPVAEEAAMTIVVASGLSCAVNRPHIGKALPQMRLGLWKRRRPTLDCQNMLSLTLIHEKCWCLLYRSYR